MAKKAMNRAEGIAALRGLGSLEPVSEEWNTWEEFEQGHPQNPNMPLLALLGWREEPGMDGDDFQAGERARGHGHVPFDPDKSKSWRLGWLEEDAAQELRQEMRASQAVAREEEEETEYEAPEFPHAHPPGLPLDELAGELPVKTVVALAMVGTRPEDEKAAVAMHQRIMKAFEAEVASGASPAVVTITVASMCLVAAIELLRLYPRYAEHFRHMGHRAFRPSRNMVPGEEKEK
jgi:hypothetical protein